MQSSNIPSKIPLPFAYAAGTSYRNTIPTASQIGIANGRASLTDGFPPLTFTPISSGGVPPFGGDVNGILYEITAIQQWQQAGGFFPFDSAFATAVGGYPKGAILQAAAFGGLWISTIENNSNNPDTGGTGWTSLAFEGLQSISVTTADVTLTQLQSAYPVLVISGALTGNRNLIFPAIVGEWIVQNNTSGAYTLTAKTSSGTGVTLTQNASTYIYGDGTNIVFADSAKVASFNGRTGTVTLNATDVVNALGYTPVPPNGTGSTGTWLFDRIEVSDGSVTAPSITFKTDGGLDTGFWHSADGFINVGTNAQQASYWDPNGNFAVRGNIWKDNYSDRLVGVNEFVSSLAGNGYQKLPNGYIFQWGKTNCGTPSIINFPITFPNALLGVIVVESNASGAWGALRPSVHGWDSGTSTNSYFVGWAEGWTGSNWSRGIFGQQFLAWGY